MAPYTCFCSFILAQASKKKRKSRWGPDSDKCDVGPPVVATVGGKVF